MPRISHEIARGKYLVTVGSCTDCHTPGSFFGKPDMSKYLGGSDVGFAIPHLGVFVGPNLTPDKATGLGNWTDCANRRCDYERTNPAGPHAGAGHAVARLRQPDEVGRPGDRRLSQKLAGGFSSGRRGRSGQTRPRQLS